MNEVKCLYVSPEGCDEWSGTLPEPFATLKKAIEEARSQKIKKIILRRGSYYDVAVKLTAEDSGLTIEAHPGERPVLYGGRKITGWKKEDAGEFWYARLPEAAEGSWDFRMLSVSGRLCDRARLPETGAYEHLSEFNVDWLSTSDGGWARKPTFEELTTLIYNPADLGPWLDIKNAELTVFHKWDESMAGIASHDIEAHTFKLSNPCGAPPGAYKYYKYAVWNVREGMTRPGQWYLDRTAGRLVYWPMPGENMEKLEVIVPSTYNILDFTQKACDITIKGLRISVANTPLIAANFAAIRMPGAVQSLQGLENCRFEDLIIENTAGHGIKIEGINRNVDIKNCEVSNTGAGGIVFYNNKYEMDDDNILVVAPSMSREEASLEAVSCNIHNNVVSNVGSVSPSAVAIGALYCNITHNEVTNTTYTGICSGGDCIRIENNIVSKAMQVLNDGAAIYVTFCRDGIIRGNVIKDIQQGSESDSGRNAIYLDEQTVDWVVEENLVINCSHPEFNHMAQKNIVRSNYFVSDSYIKLNLIRCSDYNVTGNIFYSGGEIIFAGNEDAIADCGNNILYSETDKYEYYYINEKYQQYDTVPLKFRQGTIKADPMFEDITSQNFRLAANSPAFGLGIRQLDFSRAGRI